jgi:hypothetical protein
VPSSMGLYFDPETQWWKHSGLKCLVKMGEWVIEWKKSYYELLVLDVPAGRDTRIVGEYVFQHSSFLTLDPWGNHHAKVGTRGFRKVSDFHKLVVCVFFPIMSCELWSQTAAMLFNSTLRIILSGRCSFECSLFQLLWTTHCTLSCQLFCHFRLDQISS